METVNLQKLETVKGIIQWNNFALKVPEMGTIAHNPSLFYFFSGYLKHPTFYILLFHGNQLVALLPLVRMGKKIVSIPHFSYGGILSIKPNTQDFESQLIRNICNKILDNNFLSGFYRCNIDGFEPEEIISKSHIEIRNLNPFFENIESTKVTLWMKLHSEHGVVFNSNLRRKINKAKKNGLVIKRGSHDLIPDFTEVYNRNMQNIGSPTLGKRFFNELLMVDGSNAEIVVAYLEKKPIGGGFCMWYDGYYENVWFSTLQKYNKLYTSYLLHDTMIKSAIEKGATTYSMGRSTKGSGAHHYKQQWPVEEKELFFSNTIESEFSLKDQKWLTSIWKRLPGFLVDVTGPYFAKKLY